MKNIIILLLLLVGCKSKKAITETKLDLVKTTIDNTITESNKLTLDYSLDEIVIDIYEPTKETTISDNKGNTSTFKNVKSISIKKQKESLKKDSMIVKTDIKEVIKDKTQIKQEKESISDAVHYKWIFISLAVIVLALVIWWFFK